MTSDPSRSTSSRATPIPKVHEYEGDVYRDMLMQRAKDRHVDVVFDPEYRSLASPGPADQRVDDGDPAVRLARSGHLGRFGRRDRRRPPVIATAFPHAVELLSSGAGLVVPRRDPEALADAIREVLTTPGLVEAMASEARRLAPDLAWPVIASRYAALGEELLDNRAPLSANR